MASLKSFFLLPTIVFADFLAGAEIDLLVPSFPEIQSIFSLSAFGVELLLGLNLAAMCLGALWMGIWGDTFGKKRMLLWGTGVFILGSLLTLSFPSYEMILAGRILQGLGVSACHVLGYALLADLYPPERMQILMGVLNGAVGLGMAVAPLIGSFVTEIFHWQGNLVLLLSLGILGYLLFWAFLPEDRRLPMMNWSFSLRSYGQVFRSQKALRLILCVSLMSVPYFVFIALAPLLYIESFGLSLPQFGVYQFMLAFGWAFASFFNGILLGRFGNRGCLSMGIGIMVFCTVGVCILGLVSSQNPILITGLLMLFSVGIIFPFNLFYPLALQSIPEAKGRVSALLVASRLIFTACGIQGVSLVYTGTFASLGVSLTFLIGLIFVSYIQLYKISPEAWQ